MQKRYKIILILFFIGMSFQAFSQSENYPIVIDVGINDIDFSRRITDKPINNGHNIFFPRLGVSWLVYDKFMVNISGTINNILAQNNRYLFYSVDTEIEYAILNPLNKFVPSLYGGVGYNLTEGTQMVSVNGGVILKYWLSNAFGLRVQAGIKQKIAKNSSGLGVNHMYYAVGVLFPLELFDRNRKNSDWRNVDCY